MALRTCQQVVLVFVFYVTCRLEENVTCSAELHEVTSNSNQNYMLTPEVQVNTDVNVYGQAQSDCHQITKGTF